MVGAISSQPILLESECNWYQEFGCPFEAVRGRGLKLMEGSWHWRFRYRMSSCHPYLSSGQTLLANWVEVSLGNAQTVLRVNSLKSTALQKQTQEYAVSGV